MSNMTNTSPSEDNDSHYTSPITPPVPSDVIPRAPIRRARPQLSCTPCRQGKLKCNREHPVCDQCTKRSRQDVCKYPPPPTKTKQAHNMRGRIRNLENLVVSLINQKGQDSASVTTASPSLSSTAQDGKDELGAERLGQLHISPNGNETKYVGAGHWSNILKEIEEVRETLDEYEDEIADEEQCAYANSSSMITFGMPRPMTKSQLISALPPREEINRLLPLWFHSFDPLLFIIHAPTFQKTYNNFWLDPPSASPMWIALLYSAMALSIITGPRNPGMNASYTALFGRKDSLSQSADRFLQLASSAFALGDVAKNQPYTLEALMIYTECEFLRRDDGHSKVWLMHGMALRVALRMGYHRDPTNFPEISPFDGEMRRRIWQILTVTDNLISFAIGLPTLVRSVVSDTKTPSNYIDSDLDPNMTELPPPRPVTDVTTALYHLSKRGVVDVFSEAAELNHKLTPPKHSEIMELDERLKEAYSRYPEALRIRPMDESIGDMPTLIMCRYNIEMTYQKSRIVLHRNFLKAGQTNPKYAESRNVCVEAALKTLKYHREIFHACQPGGHMSKIWWYTSALQTYDFLLSASVLSLELDHLKSTGDKSPKVTEYWDLLQATHDIWANNPTRFRESARGAELLKAILKKYSDKKDTQKASQNIDISGFDLSPNNVGNQPTPESLSDMQGTTLPTGTTQPEGQFFDMFDAPSEVDWALWDSTLQGSTSMLPQQGTMFPQDDITMFAQQPSFAPQQSWPAAASDSAFLEPWLSNTTTDPGTAFDPLMYEFNGYLHQMSAGDSNLDDRVL